MSGRKKTTGIVFEGYGNKTRLSDLRILITQADLLSMSEDAVLRVTVHENDTRVTSIRLVDDEPEEDEKP